MNHTIFLIKGSRDENYEVFSKRIKTLINDKVIIQHPSVCKLTITEEAPPRLSMIPFNKEKIAAVTVSSEEFDFLSIFSSVQGFSGAYNADAVLPLSYTKERPEGEKTPGIGLLTLFFKKKGQDRRDFLDCWFNSHTPLTLELHPVCNYLRNEIKGLLFGFTVDSLKELFKM